MALVLILGVSAYVRFAGQRGQGIIFYDEAAQLMEARFLRRTVAVWRLWLSGESPGSENALREIGALPAGVPLQYGKPIHTAVLAAAQAALGDHDHAGQAASAMFGVATVLLCFWLGAALYGRRVGLAAALLLGLSGYHVAYSRQALAEADSVFFFVLATCLHVGAKGERRCGLFRLCCAGVCVGLCYAANYRWFFAPVLFWGYEIFTPGRSWRRLALISIGMALPLVMIEALFAINRAVITHAGVAVPCETYFQQLWYLNFRHPTSAKGFNLRGVPTYAYLIAKLNGPMTLFALCVGLLRIVIERRRGDGVVLSQFGAPFLFFTFHVFKYARFLSLALPALAIIAARGIMGATRARGQWLRAGLLAAVVFGQLVPLREVVALRSGYRQAVSFIASRGITRCFSTEGPIAQYHLGVHNAQEPPGTIERLLDKASREGVHHLLVGPLRWRPRFREIVRFADAHLETIGRFPNPAASCVQYAFEHNRDFAEAMRLHRELRNDEIVLYRLGD